MGKTVKHDPIELAPLGNPRKGHYNFQGKGKIVFDNRPKRGRTRQSQKRAWLES